MGKQSRSKKDAVIAEVQSLLQDSQLVMVIDYKGLTVTDLNELRAVLRPSNSTCMVVKNTLMTRAITLSNAWEPMSQFLVGQTAFIITPEDISGAIKAYQDYLKKAKKTEFRGAVLDGTALNNDQLKAIADLPPKEILMAQVAGAINAVTAKVATAINEVPSSLARVIQAIADKEAA